MYRGFVPYIFFKYLLLHVLTFKRKSKFFLCKIIKEEKMLFTEKLKKFIYINILHKKYYRAGSCKRCGACCKRIYVSHGKHTIDSEEEFKKLQGQYPFYSYLKVDDKDDIGLVFSCANFDEEKHICRIHKTRPGICRRYPDEFVFTMGACLSDGCGYSFTPIENFIYVFADVQKRPVKNCIIFTDDI